MIYKIPVIKRWALCPAAVQEQYPDAAVMLTVDGKSNNDI